MSTLVYVSHDCGFRGRYDSVARAQYALRQHSCERARRERAAYVRGQERAAAVDRTPKPCLHKRANHQHGTYACYVLDTCRCLPCTLANTDYESARTRQRAYGRTAFVPTAPALAHIRALQAAGMGWKRIAAAAGVQSSTLYPLLYGRPDRNNGAPRTKARRELVDAILAVPMPTLDDLGGATPVDSTGTRRRLQALMTLGWSVQRLADTRGMARRPLDHALAGGPVLVSTARAVRDAYDALWDQTPPARTRGERIAIAKTRARALTASWPPPLAWDDDTIDDPAATPAADAPHGGIDDAAIERAITGDRARPLTRAERWVAVERLARTGVTDVEIARLLGVTDKTVLRDRQDLGIESTRSAA